MTTTVPPPPYSTSTNLLLSVNYSPQYQSFRFSRPPPTFFFFFLNDPAPPKISPLPLPAALPFCKIVPAGAAPAELVNDWVGTNGNWHDLTWSLGVRPDSSQSVRIIGGARTVTINATTAASYQIGRAHV